MTNLQRLTVKLHREPAIVCTPAAYDAERLVYLLVADKRLIYENGRSRIVYIGTTQNGISRVATSVVERAPLAFDEAGVRSVEARIVSCAPRQRVRTWRKLERAMLISFREMFGAIPFCNERGDGISERDEFDYFARRRIDEILKTIG